jgi:hypothetical protein
MAEGGLKPLVPTYLKKATRKRRLHAMDMGATIQKAAAIAAAASAFARTVGRRARQIKKGAPFLAAAKVATAAVIDAESAVYNSLAFVSILNNTKAVNTRPKAPESKKTFYSANAEACRRLSMRFQPRSEYQPQAYKPPNAYKQDYFAALSARKAAKAQKQPVLSRQSGLASDDADAGKQSEANQRMIEEGAQAAVLRMGVEREPELEAEAEVATTVVDAYLVQLFVDKNVLREKEKVMFL